MIHVNPTHLRSFLAVAGTGSITRAAQCVSRVPSAVTHAVQDLESSLDVSLFERHPHGMRLTEFGSLLRHRSELAFQEMDKARQALDDLPQARPYKHQAPLFTLGITRQRLLVFVALIEQCHMGTVARSFGISQAAVSLALKDIEQSLGLTLLARTPTNLVPNEAGRLLALHVQRALGELSKAEEEIATRLHGITGHVVVGTLSLGRGWLLPQAILQVSRQHPDIRISTVEGSFEHLVAMLHATRIDFMLGGLRPAEQMPGLLSRSVLLSGIVFLGRARASRRASGRHRRMAVSHRCPLDPARPRDLDPQRGRDGTCRARAAATLRRHRNGRRHHHPGPAAHQRSHQRGLAPSVPERDRRRRPGRTSPRARDGGPGNRHRHAGEQPAHDCQPPADVRHHRSRGRRGRRHGSGAAAGWLDTATLLTLDGPAPTSPQ